MHAYAARGNNEENQEAFMNRLELLGCHCAIFRDLLVQQFHCMMIIMRNYSAKIDVVLTISKVIPQLHDLANYPYHPVECWYPVGSLCI